MKDTDSLTGGNFIDSYAVVCELPRRLLLSKFSFMRGFFVFFIVDASDSGFLKQMPIIYSSRFKHG